MESFNGIFERHFLDIFLLLLYINDLLFFCRDLHEHNNQLDIFYELVYKYGLVLSPTK